MEMQGFKHKELIADSSWLTAHREKGFFVTAQVDRLKAVRKKRILKPCLVQESAISAKVRQSCSYDPFSLQSKQLQPDYLLRWIG